jgi:heme-degrading monooxygenase HmoA
VVARHWRGWIRSEDAERYTAYVQETGIDELVATPGNHGAQIWLRPVGERTEIVVVSYWDSRDSIRAFAGDDIEVAHYYPEDEEFLVERDMHVTHYDVVSSA